MDGGWAGGMKGREERGSFKGCKDHDGFTA